MTYEIFIGILSIIGLLAGAEIVIDRATRMASHLKISGFFVGLTVFSIGTSLPEIALHIISSVNILRGVGDMDTLSGLVVGTNVGSDIVQITLIMGVVTMFGVLRVSKKFLKVDYIVMLLATLILFLLSLDGFVSRFEGAVLLLLYGGYLYYLAHNSRFNEKLDAELRNGGKARFFLNLLSLFGGMIMLILSADQISRIVELMSDRYSLSGSLIGATIVGLSTSLPELTTAVISLRKKKVGMTMGTLVGSNITNPLMGIGLGALISGYSVEPVILWFDIPFYLVISLVPMAMLWFKGTINRFGGLLLLFSYFGYLLIRVDFL